MSLSRLASQNAGRAIAAAPSSGAPTVAAANRDDRFDLLTKYIPTETITLYVAAMSVRSEFMAFWPRLSPSFLYWTGAVLTPLMLVLIARGKHRLAASPGVPFRIPLWPMAASLVAFLVWALSVPGLIAESNSGARVLAGFGAVLISTILSLLDPLFGER